MSRAWRLSGQTAFESDLLEALSLLLLRTALGSKPVAKLISREEVEQAKKTICGLLAKFLAVHKAGQQLKTDPENALSTREHTVWIALRKILIAERDRFEQLLEDAIEWVSLSRGSVDDPEMDFLRQVEAIVASDLQSWCSRLRSSV